jgi:hypothetical protein
VPAVKTLMAITSVAGALAFSATAYADTPVDAGAPTAQDEGAPLPGGDPVPADPNWVDTTPVPEYDGAPLPGGDPAPARGDPRGVDTTPTPDDEGAPLPGGDPAPAPAPGDPNRVDDTKPAYDGDEAAPLPGGDPDPVWTIAASIIARSF